MKITAEDWYESTKDLFHPKEIIYVATDEKDKTFFAPLAKHYALRCLNDFSDVAGEIIVHPFNISRVLSGAYLTVASSMIAGLREMDPNLMGMIDTIVASRGRLFVGTWFSTFTGFIVSSDAIYVCFIILPSGPSCFPSLPERIE